MEKPSASRDEILGNSNFERRRIYVTGWKRHVWIQELTEDQRERLATILSDTEEKKHFNARVVSLAVVDEDGNRVFTDADVARLANQPTRAILQVFQAVYDISALTPGAVEKLGKDCAATGDAASSSDSA